MSKISLGLNPKIIEVQQYTTGTDSVTFFFDRHISSNSTFDLADLKSKIVVTSKNIIESGLNDDLVQSNNDTKVILTWKFDSVVTANAGEYGFQIIFVDSNNEIKMHTDVGKLIVNESLNLETVIFVENLSLLQQWEDKIDREWKEKLDSAEDKIRDDLKDYHDSEIDKVEAQISALDTKTNNNLGLHIETSEKRFEALEKEIDDIKLDLSKCENITADDIINLFKE